MWSLIVVIFKDYTAWACEGFFLKKIKGYIVNFHIKWKPDRLVDFSVIENSDSDLNTPSVMTCGRTKSGKQPS